MRGKTIEEKATLLGGGESSDEKPETVGGARRRRGRGKEVYLFGNRRNDGY